MDVDEPEPGSGQAFRGDQLEELRFRGETNGRKRTEQRHYATPFSRVADRQFASHERVIPQLSERNEDFQARQASPEVIDPD